MGSTETFYYLTYCLGSTMALTDDAGAVDTTWDYDVFGAVRSLTVFPNLDSPDSLGISEEACKKRTRGRGCRRSCEAGGRSGSTPLTGGFRLSSLARRFRALGEDLA